MWTLRRRLVAAAVRRRKMRRPVASRTNRPNKPARPVAGVREGNRGRQRHMRDPIQFYFDFSSPYGFIAAMEIDDLASRVQRKVLWRPFLLSAVFRKYGQSPLDHVAKRNYVNDIDAPRSARARGMTLKRPDGWPQHSLPPSRIFYWIDAENPDIARNFARAAYRAYWLEGRSTADGDAAIDVATSLGLARDDVAAGMRDPITKDRLLRASDEAVDRGVFGSPFFIADGELFWGSDRMDQMQMWLKTGPF